MTAKLIIILSFISSIFFAQKSDIKKIKVKRETKADSLNAVGRWLRVFDTDNKGEKIKPSVVDTLCFFPNKIYMRYETGGKITANWTLDQKNKKINLINQKLTAYIKGNLIQDNFGDSSYDIDRVTKDTLTGQLHYKLTYSFS